MNRPLSTLVLCVCALLALHCVTTPDDSAGDTAPVDSADTGDSAVVPLNLVAVDADIVTDTTWTADNLYRVDASIAVTAALTLEPGTLVKLGDGAKVTVNAGGSIVHTGDDAHRCVFTSIHDDEHGGDTEGDGAATAPARGDWGSIAVRESGSVFDHCDVFYGGGTMPYAGALSVSDDAVITVTHSRFAHDQGGTPEDTRAAAFNAGGGGRRDRGRGQHLLG